MQSPPALAASTTVLQMKSKNSSLSYKDASSELALEEAEAEKEMDTFPEGGTAAYLAVWGGFCCIGSTFGLSNVFGVLQAHFAENQLSAYEPSKISLIGSVHLSIIFGSGIVSGRLFDLGYFRYQLGGGSLLWLIGVFMLSLSTTYTQIFLSYSVCMGIGLGQLFAPCLSCVATYFQKKRVLMLGIVASGASVVAVVFPIILNELFKTIGYSQALRIIGYIMTAMLLVSNFSMKPRRLPKRILPNSLKLIKAFLTQSETWFSGLAVFFVMTGIFIPLFYFQQFASRILVDYSLAIVNAAATISRVIVGLAADRFGPINTGIPVAAITGILAYAMLGAVSLPGAVVFLLLYGLASGAWVTIFTPLFMSLAIDSSEIGTRAGVGYFFVSLATLVGTPIAGALLAGSGTYTAPVLFSGSAALVGSSILVVFRGRQVAKKGNWKC